jgi:hypothetical protein
MVQHDDIHYLRRLYRVLAIAVQAADHEREVMTRKRIEDTFIVEHHAEPAYAVIYKHGCRIINGPIPADDFRALAHAWQLGNNASDWLADPVLAKLSGASFVLGPRDAITAWRKKVGLPPPA